ncbi:MAG: type I restriction endonuclease subunit S [Pseudoalteromonas sp.]|nr:type I restriction endonuclease subunit S [Pseudoalteromonas sp.]
MNVFNNVPLKEVCKVISGYAFKSATFKTGGSTPVIKIKNIKIGTASLEDAGYVDSSFLESVDKKYKVMGDDILISLTGSHMNQPNSVVGRVGRYPCKYPVALLNQRAGKVIPNEELVDKTYLFYALLGDDVRREIAQMAHGAASQANVSPSQVESVEIPLPDLKLQEKIGSVLNNYDQLIENNNRRISILEDMAQSLYREWFVNFRYPNHKDNLDADGNPKLVDSPLGQIPEGWEIKTAAEAITVNPRTKLAKDGEKPFVGMSGLSESSMVISDITKKTGNSGAKFINGDTLFARITPCLQNGKTGYVHFLNEEQPVGFGSTEFIVLRESEDLSSEYIYLLSRSNDFREHAIKSMTGATGRQRVHPDSFASYYLAVPPKELMAEFSKQVKPMFKSIYNLSRRSQNLKQQRVMLLPKLISGEIQL